MDSDPASMSSGAQMSPDTRYNKHGDALLFSLLKPDLSQLPSNSPLPLRATQKFKLVHLHHIPPCSDILEEIMGSHPN